MSDCLRTMVFGLACGAFVLGACGDTPKEEAGSIAKALAYESKERAAADAASKAKTAELAKHKADEDAKAKEIADGVAAVAVLPASYPKKLKDGCEEVAKAYEQFMRDNRDPKLVMEWFNDKNQNIANQRSICEQGTVEAAACITNALKSAPDPLFDLGEEAVTKIKVACADKFGTTAKK